MPKISAHVVQSFCRVLFLTIAVFGLWVETFAQSQTNLLSYLKSPDEKFEMFEASGKSASQSFGITGKQVAGGYWEISVNNAFSDEADRQYQVWKISIDGTEAWIKSKYYVPAEPNALPFKPYLLIKFPAKGKSFTYLGGSNGKENVKVSIENRVINKKSFQDCLVWAITSPAGPAESFIEERVFYLGKGMIQIQTYFISNGKRGESLEYNRYQGENLASTTVVQSFGHELAYSSRIQFLIPFLQRAFQQAGIQCYTSADLGDKIGLLHQRTAYRIAVSKAFNEMSISQGTSIENVLISAGISGQIANSMAPIIKEDRNQ
jgi:hypothetical protein